MAPTNYSDQSKEMIPKRQHWVPRLLLRQFTDAPHLENPDTQVFDVISGKRFKTSIMNVAQEKHFYNTRERSGGRETLEDWLDKTVEGPASAPLKRLREPQHGASISDEDRLAIARFVVTLAVRDRNKRTEIEEFPGKILEFFDSRGEVLADNLRREIEADMDSAAIHNKLIVDISQMAQPIAQMSWFLGNPPPGREFCSSDNPVLRFNPIDAGPYGNLGLLCRGIQLWLAVAPDLMLVIVDAASYPGDVSPASPIMSDQDLLAYNARLAATASKFLFSRRGDFDFRPDMRTGEQGLVMV